MSGHQWRQGGPEHLALARRLFDHECDSGFADPMYKEQLWQQDVNVQSYLELAWVAITHIGEVHQAKRDAEKANPPVDPDKWVAPAPVKGTRTEPIWRQPRQPCAGGVHNFFLDEDLNVLACHDCDWFEESA